MIQCELGRGQGEPTGGGGGEGGRLLLLAAKAVAYGQEALRGKGYACFTSWLGGSSSLV